MGDKVWPKDVSFLRASEIGAQIQELLRIVNEHRSPRIRNSSMLDHTALTLEHILNDLYIASHEGGHDEEAENV